MSKLRPVIVITIMNEENQIIDSDKLPYDGDAMAVTDSINDLLEKHKDVPGVVALPTTGYELNQ